MKIRSVMLLVLLVLSGCQSPQKPSPTPSEVAVDSTPPTSARDSNEVQNFALNAAKSKPQPQDLTLDYPGLKIVFTPAFRHPRYVVYTLTAQNLKDRYIKRDKDTFTRDPQLLKEHKDLVVTGGNYANSGYQRGHMAPAEDLTWNEDAFFATFHMSNMSPQAPDLNTKSWQELEFWVRDAACGEGKVTVITGPVFSEPARWMMKGKKKITVIPPAFFKIVVDETPPRKVAAFLYTQKDLSPGMMEQRMVKPGEIEAKTGIDFGSEIKEAKTLFKNAKTSVRDWNVVDDKVSCPQRTNQILASELKRRRNHADEDQPRLPSSTR